MRHNIISLYFPINIFALWPLLVWHGTPTQWEQFRLKNLSGETHTSVFGSITLLLSSCLQWTHALYYPAYWDGLLTFHLDLFEQSSLSLNSLNSLSVFAFFLLLWLRINLPKHRSHNNSRVTSLYNTDRNILEHSYYLVKHFPDFPLWEYTIASFKQKLVIKRSNSVLDEFR